MRQSPSGWQCLAQNALPSARHLLPAAIVKLSTFPFHAMGGPCELRLYADSGAQAQAAADAAIAEVMRIEHKYSRYRDDSELSAINRSAGGEPVAVDEETAALLDYATTAHAESDGLFDISSGVLRRAWDFKSGRLPEATELAALRARVGWHKLHWQRPQIRLEAGMELDFGGFGKEYAADSAARLCREQGIAHGLVELGGDIHVIGPHPGGAPWQIGIRHPRDPERAITVLPLSEGGLASSGDYERYMIVDGQRYCHILDPRSGWPVRDAPAGVSVVAPLCLLAGTAATVAMLKGVEAGDWLAQLGLPYLCIAGDGGLSGELLAPP